jgi:hypothetical protein
MRVVYSSTPKEKLSPVIVSALATKQVKCSISVIAGLVPGAYVVGLPVLLYCYDLHQSRRRTLANLFTFLKFDHVAGRDNPGNDGAD